MPASRSSDTRSLDIPETAACIRWHAEAIDKLYDQVAPTGPGAVAMVVREPLGVVGAVVPWNYPLQMAAWKLGPALATGNSVVIKPAEQTSLSLLRIAELAAEAGLPDGVLNVVTGPGGVVGQGDRAATPTSMCVAFTGSTEVGRTFLHHAAETNLKRVVLELGGKSPQVIMADAANLDRVADQVANAIFWNMGENCCAGSRLLVHRDVKDEFLERLSPVARDLDRRRSTRRRDTHRPDDHRRAHASGCSATSRRASTRAPGSSIGGARVLEETGGYFVAPTIFDGARNDMRIAQRGDLRAGPHGHRVLHRGRGDRPCQRHAVRARGLDLHGECPTSPTGWPGPSRPARSASTAYSEGDMTTPFGGFKQSGFGGHDKSVHAHDQYTELKTIWLDMAEG